LADLDREI